VFMDGSCSVHGLAHVPTRGQTGSGPPSLMRWMREQPLTRLSQIDIAGCKSTSAGGKQGAAGRDEVAGRRWAPRVAGVSRLPIRHAPGSATSEGSDFEQRSRPAHAPLVGLYSAAAMVIVGCGGTQPGAPRPPITSSATAAPKTTADPADVAVLQAYRAEWGAYLQAAATADAYAPALPVTMVDPLLQRVRANLIADRLHGVVGQGTIDLHPHVASRNGNTAVVLDCAFSRSVRVYQATGQQVPPAAQPENIAIKSTLAEVSPGAWKVSDQTVTDGTCPPGY